MYGEAARRLSDSLTQWEGLPVRRISFDGVSLDRLAPLPGHLAQAVGAPLNREELKKSLRQLFRPACLKPLRWRASAKGTAWPWSFAERRAVFIGTVSVDGAKGATVNTQLGARQPTGARRPLTPAKLSQALEQMRATLVQTASTSR
jgi:outer membrane protein insertion porin family